MADRGRPRSSANMPAHINAAKLPDRVWFNTSGKGRWMLWYYDEFGKRRNKRLCGPKSTLADIYQAVEAQKQKTIETFSILSLEFEQTHIWKKLTSYTQKDYTNCRNAIINRDTTSGDGKLGDLPLNKWTVGLVRRYRDKRAETSESRANKELAYIKRIFSWAYEYEKVPLNPASGVKKISIPPRQHYTEDKDYEYLLDIAKQSGYGYMPYAMELAYLCRMRTCEVLELTDASELENGLRIKGRKGSKTNITVWEPRLRAAFDGLKQRRDAILAKRKQPHPIKAEMRFLMISARTGNLLSESGMGTAMKRLKDAAKKKSGRDNWDFDPFTFHDLKRKGVTDTPSDQRMKSARHRSPEMMRIYDVAVDVVKPTKK